MVIMDNHGCACPFRHRAAAVALSADTVRMRVAPTVCAKCRNSHEHTEAGNKAHTMNDRLSGDFWHMLIPNQPSASCMKGKKARLQRKVPGFRATS